MVEEQGRPAERSKPSFLDTMRAVGASFFGVRGRRAHEEDFARLNPVHVVIAGVLAALVFIVVLVVAVRLAVG